MKAPGDRADQRERGHRQSEFEWRPNRPPERRRDDAKHEQRGGQGDDAAAPTGRAAVVRGGGIAKPGGQPGQRLVLAVTGASCQVGQDVPDVVDVVPETGHGKAGEQTDRPGDDRRQHHPPVPAPGEIGEERDRKDLEDGRHPDHHPGLHILTALPCGPGGGQQKQQDGVHRSCPHGVDQGKKSCQYGDQPEHLGPFRAADPAVDQDDA